MKLKYNNSEAMLYEYIDQLFDEYIKTEQLNEVDLFLTKMRFEEEKELLKKKINADSEYIQRFWIIAYLSKISEEAGCILRADVTQCPFIMYLFHLASYNILKNGGLEEPYLYKRGEITIWRLRVEDDWYDSIKHRMDEFFQGTGYQYMWVGSEKYREVCGIVIFPEDVDLLKYSRRDCDRLADGTICFIEECIPVEFFGKRQMYYTYIDPLPKARNGWEQYKNKTDLWRAFIDMQCLDIAEELVVRHFKPETEEEMIKVLALAQFAEMINHSERYGQLEKMKRLSIVTKEDLWKQMMNIGMPEERAYYWSDLISRGLHKNNRYSFGKLQNKYDKYFMDILCSVPCLPSKWNVMERFYEIDSLQENKENEYMTYDISMEKQQLEILYQELQDEKFEALCLLEAEYYGWNVYGSIHGLNRKGINCYKTVNSKGKEALLAIVFGEQEIDEKTLENIYPDFDGYCVCKEKNKREKWSLLELMFDSSIEEMPKCLYGLYKKVIKMPHVFQSPPGETNLEKYF